MVDEHGPDAPEGQSELSSPHAPATDAPTGRRYLPTLAELIDRLTIVQLKEIFISEHAPEYRAERALVEHDIDLVLAEKAAAGFVVDAKTIRAIVVVMLANRCIWESEGKARAGGPQQDHLLKFSHSINGVRNTAKNQISVACGDRRDHKVDALAAELATEFGNWHIFADLDDDKAVLERG